MPFSSCDKYKRNNKQKKKAFDRVPRDVVRWTLKKLGVEEWFIGTVMALYTEDGGLSESFDVKVDFLSWMLSPVRREVVSLPSCGMLMT